MSYPNGARSRFGFRFTSHQTPVHPQTGFPLRDYECKPQTTAIEPDGGTVAAKNHDDHHRRRELLPGPTQQPERAALPGRRAEDGFPRRLLPAPETRLRHDPARPDDQRRVGQAEPGRVETAARGATGKCDHRSNRPSRRGALEGDDGGHRRSAADEEQVGPTGVEVRVRRKEGERDY
ncbi:proline-rich receptor-like protein kinase PERK9 [Iris pallida]|uniref:Proline-rich receptor-like protein kinase PERK9 n=1 Tax=Iris pallida TaxID=29817 RepID=A0AAX6GIA4_IRIPA|nr:proline-rich receptor-like protein kinase PERK9 [Iris pallida]